MKQTICPLLIFLFFFTSCSSTCFFSTLNTSSVSSEYVEKVENGDFLLETDSLWIAYCFKGESAPVQVTVFNKLDVPLYVDWQRSALILNGTAYSYGKGSVSISGSTSGVIDSYDAYGGSYGYTEGSFAGNVELPKNISFVPPNSMISYIPLRLDMRFDNINKKLYKDGYLGGKTNTAVKVKKITYSESDTPLRFESYLTVYARPEKPMTFRQGFYMANLIKTRMRPGDIAGDMADRGDFFFVEKPANNTFWHVVLGTTLVAGAVAIEVAVDANDRY